MHGGTTCSSMVHQLTRYQSSTNHGITFYYIYFLKIQQFLLRDMLVGADRWIGGREFIGYFGEIIAFNAKLTDANRHKIEGVFSPQMGIIC